MKIIKPKILKTYDTWDQYETPYIPPGVALTAAQKMWADTKGEHSVVAVIDTGIDYRHADLAENVIGGVSFVNGFMEKDYLDENGHGTHVAGVIAANGAILGAAPDAKLLAVKVLDRNVQGTFGNVAKGISWARKWRGANGEKVNIMNLSLGGPLSHTDLHNEIKKALNDNIVVICAAGNAGDGDSVTDEISYPAFYSECISVGAVDNNTQSANFSNSNSNINIAAPGVDTYSTYLDNTYAKLSGTSVASPHISGAAALICSHFFKRFGRYPLPQYVRELLDFMAIDLGNIGFDQLTGYGFFSFNIDGGKAYQLKIGQEKYYVNGTEKYLSLSPFLQNGQVCLTLNDMADFTNIVHHITPEPSEISIWL
ncbi:MAG: S8 family peptidase [Syntrophomonadaceae bacterium]|jgi:major intracellular serine protease|nr:S8 family peptidase [Syntrophomonadaceae bacterium]